MLIESRVKIRPLWRYETYRLLRLFKKIKLPFTWRFFYKTRLSFIFYLYKPKTYFVYTGKKWRRFRSTKWITGFTLYNFCFFSQIAIYKKRQLIKEKLKQQKLLLKEKNRLKRLSKKKK